MLERRRKRRFSIHQPATCKVEDSSGSHEVDCVVDNVNEIGALIIADRTFATGTNIEIVINAKDGICLCATAKVVRLDEARSDGKVGIGIECTQPFLQNR